MEAVRPKERRASVSASQLLLEFSSTVPAIGRLVPTTPKIESSIPTQVPQKVEITPIDPAKVQATRAQSNMVDENIEDRNSPYAKKSEFFPDVI